MRLKEIWFEGNLYILVSCLVSKYVIWFVIEGIPDSYKIDVIGLYLRNLVIIGWIKERWKFFNNGLLDHQLEQFKTLRIDNLLSKIF